ncbi:MAG: hypothetical protein JXR95_14625 [Deltaproteobacteria bacterium]|nr:hypothetical protein [Deltaproteobacteria bacterium]
MLIYNKLGQVSGDDRLEHGLVVDPSSGERWFVAASLPYNTTTDADLGNLIQKGILAVKNSEDAGVMLSPDSGIEIIVQCDAAVLPQVNFTISAPGADRVDLYVDRWFLGSDYSTSDIFRIEHNFDFGGTRQLVVVAYNSGNISGIRTMNMIIPE